MVAAIATMASSALPPSARMSRPASAAALMRRRDDPAAVTGGVQGSCGFADQARAVFSSGSTDGILPRNA